MQLHVKAVLWYVFAIQMCRGFVFYVLWIPQPGLKILEALAASGLRSIRYALEIPRVGTVVANDLSKEAYQSICRNVQHNQVEDKVKPSWREARWAENWLHYQAVRSVENTYMYMYVYTVVYQASAHSRVSTHVPVWVNVLVAASIQV